MPLGRAHPFIPSFIHSFITGSLMLQKYMRQVAATTVGAQHASAFAAKQDESSLDTTIPSVGGTPRKKKKKKV
jgi:hypothetical protein